MLTKNKIISLYKKYDVSASKRFGQNFLIDNNVVSKIINKSAIENKDVIEIGPGLGSLTIPMLNIASSVTSYEIDLDMIKVLNSEIKNNNFHLINKNFLEAQFEWEKRKILVANIPYNITSDILFKLFKNSHKFLTATIMVQKEVANRLLSSVGSKEYGKLKVTSSIFAKVEKIVDAKKEAFVPVPKVDSMVIKLTFNNEKYSDNIELINFIKNCFSFRRKTLINNLKYHFNVEMISRAIRLINKKQTCRPQELTLEEFKYIFKTLVK